MKGECGWRLVTRLLSWICCSRLFPAVKKKHERQTISLTNPTVYKIRYRSWGLHTSMPKLWKTITFQPLIWDGALGSFVFSIHFKRFLRPLSWGWDIFCKWHTDSLVAVIWTLQVLFQDRALVRIVWASATSLKIYSACNKLIITLWTCRDLSPGKQNIQNPQSSLHHIQTWAQILKGH